MKIDTATLIKEAQSIAAAGLPWAEQKLIQFAAHDIAAELDVVQRRDPTLSGDALIDAVYHELAHAERVRLGRYFGWLVDATWSLPQFESGVKSLISLAVNGPANLSGGDRMGWVSGASDYAKGVAMGVVERGSGQNVEATAKAAA